MKNLQKDSKITKLRSLKKVWFSTVWSTNDGAVVDLPETSGWWLSSKKDHINVISSFYYLLKDWKYHWLDLWQLHHWRTTRYVIDLGNYNLLNKLQS